MSELIISDYNFIRTWVNSCNLKGKKYLGQRFLDIKNRVVYEIIENGVKILISNKTCIKNIQIMILDDARIEYI